MEINNPSHAPSIEFSVDPEHAGVRTVGCITFFISVIVAFVIINSLIPNGGLIVIAGSVAVAVAITYVADYLTKRYWPSHRTLRIADDVVTLSRKDVVQGQINAGEHVNYMAWHFMVSKHPRVPKGWYVVSSALEQDDDYVIVYTIASPDDFKALPLSRFSAEYQRKKDKSDDDNRDLRKAGQMRRLQQAEFHRGELGAELTLEDYQAYLTHLVDTYTAWMPKDQ